MKITLMESLAAVLRFLHMTTDTVELRCLEHLWNHENMFGIGVVRDNEC